MAIVAPAGHVAVGFDGAGMGASAGDLFGGDGGGRGCCCPPAVNGVGEGHTAGEAIAGGDARKLLNIIELICNSTIGNPVRINNKIVTEGLQQNPMAYDKDGELHYDIISAFIKSIRGSDPDAAV